MIRINLLPVRAAKKKETAIQQLVLAGGVLLLILVIVLSLWAVKLGQIKSTQHDIDVANVKINELKTKIGKLENLKKLKEQVYKKLTVLSNLRKNKTGPAVRLAVLSDITPDNLWLQSYRENGDAVKVNGLAFNEELIAQFIRALEASDEYQQVELVVSEQRDIAGTKLKRFDLALKLEKPKSDIGDLK